MTAEILSIPSYKESLDELVQQLRDMIPEKQFEVFNHDAQQLGRNHAAPLVLKKGDRVPMFALPNAAGKTVQLETLLQTGPVVLTFYRGVWCPYCNLQLKTYQQILPQIKEAGAHLIAVSPMTPDNTEAMRDSNELEFEVLSDVGNKVARKFTTVFKNDAAPIQAMTELGYDFHGFYGDSSGDIPVPATFVINRSSVAVFAKSTGGDYRERVEPRDILDALSE